MRAILLKLGLFLFLFVFFAKVYFDPDLGWHLAIGNNFLQTGHFLRADIFSWTMPGYLWGNYYFVYEILVSWLFNNIGFLWLVLLFSTLISLGFVILVKKLDFLNFLLILVAASISRWSLSVRPHVFSFLFFCVLLLLLEKRLFRKVRSAPVFFGLFWIWANLHRGFVAGLMVFLTVFIIDWFFNRKKFSKWAPISLIGAVVATFLTPFHFLVWTSGIFDDFGTYQNLLYIDEWQATIFFLPVNVFFAVSGAVFAFTIFGKSLKKDPMWAVVGSFLFAFAFVSINFAIFWVAFFVFFETRYFKLEVKTVGKFYKFLEGYLRVLVFAVVALIFSSATLSIPNLMSFNKVLLASKYPVEAVDFLKKRGDVGNLFNVYGWGGYIDFASPNVKVFIDGRMAGWKTDLGRSILGDYVKIHMGDCEVLKYYKIDALLLKANDSIRCFEDFDKVYEDKVSKILVKSKK